MLVSCLKLNGVRPLYSVIRKSSQKVEDILCLYGDETYDFKDRYRVLDEKDYSRFISQRSMKREPAITRSMTSLAYKIGKEMISLAEGMPNEQIFPFDRIEISTKTGGKILLEGDELDMSLQYLPSQGLPSLLSLLREFQQDVHRPPPLERDVLITNGSQHGIYQCVDLLVDPGDPVITTEFTFTGFNSALRPYDPEILAIPEDEDGLIPSLLEECLSQRSALGQRMPRLLYTIPTGNNPTGTVLPAHRRRQIYELACKYDFLIVEDDPYAFLNYTDTRPPSFLSMDQCGRVIRLDSVSKVVCAGLRGAWATLPAPLLHRAELHMQAELLHPCTLAQVILHRVLEARGSLAAHVERTRALCRQRRDALGAALAGARDLPQFARWDTPRAGLFYWLTLHDVPDAYDMAFRTALSHGLLVCPGQAFTFATRAPAPHVRLTFTRAPLAALRGAAERLRDVLRAESARPPRRLRATDG
ncbi:kynurenine/alpha-aminoadipate aminotransferase, mitochondrial [Zerene cesonia]|uniref:kynurenine/alpha-aminoadipate aminotransferase, mitochondrial n=1 Tax=Zerene cesonia TaxID=33412 RepID=UPI0018E50C36|nr:kynurenine/alpha-aminoadipate aminotransferase, mitochondrial [Zerene cesonia]